MIWTIETSKGGFEGSRLKQIINDMIEYYGSNDQDPDQIEFIVGYGHNEREKTICENGISKISDMIEEGVADWRRSAQEEKEHQEDLRRDYYAGCL